MAMMKGDPLDRRDSDDVHNNKNVKKKNEIHDDNIETNDQQKHQEQQQQQRTRTGLRPLIRRRPWQRRSQQQQHEQQQQQPGGEKEANNDDDNDRWYFCVGPLVNPAVRERRKLNSTTHHQAAVLLDYKLIFSHSGVDVIPKIGYNVHGVVMRVPNDDDWQQIVNADKGALDRVLVDVYPYKKNQKNTNRNTNSNHVYSSTEPSSPTSTNGSDHRQSSYDQRLSHNSQYSTSSMSMSASAADNNDDDNNKEDRENDRSSSTTLSVPPIDQLRYYDGTNSNDDDCDGNGNANYFEEDEEEDDGDNVLSLLCQNHPICAYVSIIVGYDESKHKDEPIDKKKPQERYLRLIAEGMEHHGVSQSYVSDEIMSCPYVPKRSREDWYKFPTAATTTTTTTTSSSSSMIVDDRMTKDSNATDTTCATTKSSACYNSLDRDDDDGDDRHDQDLHDESHTNDHDHDHHYDDLPTINMRHYLKLCRKSMKPGSDVYFILHKYVLKMDGHVHDPKNPMIGWMRCHGHGQQDLSHEVHQIVVDPDIPWARSPCDMTQLHYDWAEDHMFEAMELAGTKATKVYRLIDNEDTTSSFSTTTTTTPDGRSSSSSRTSLSKRLSLFTGVGDSNAKESRSKNNGNVKGDNSTDAADNGDAGTSCMVRRIRNSLTLHRNRNSSCSKRSSSTSSSSNNHSEA